MTTEQQVWDLNELTEVRQEVSALSVTLRDVPEETFWFRLAPEEKESVLRRIRGLGDWLHRLMREKAALRKLGYDAPYSLYEWAQVQMLLPHAYPVVRTLLRRCGADFEYRKGFDRLKPVRVKRGRRGEVGAARGVARPLWLDSLVSLEWMLGSLSTVASKPVHDSLREMWAVKASSSAWVAAGFLAAWRALEGFAGYERMPSGPVAASALGLCSLVGVWFGLLHRGYVLFNAPYVAAMLDMAGVYRMETVRRFGLGNCERVYRTLLRLVDGHTKPTTSMMRMSRGLRRICDLVDRLVEHLDEHGVAGKAASLRRYDAVGEWNERLLVLPYSLAKHNGLAACLFLDKFDDGYRLRHLEKGGPDHALALELLSYFQMSGFDVLDQLNRMRHKLEDAGLHIVANANKLRGLSVKAMLGVEKLPPLDDPFWRNLNHVLMGDAGDK
jgi:hypothetical protein